MDSTAVGANHGSVAQGAAVASIQKEPTDGCNHGGDCGVKEVLQGMNDKFQTVVKQNQAAVEQNHVLTEENAGLRAEIAEYGGQVDRFLAGLHEKMDDKQLKLFLALHLRGEVGGVKRFLSYTQIGKRFGGITKQAIGCGVSELFKIPGVKEYIVALRNPRKITVRDSELSPSERRKNGIGESYGYDAR